MKKEMSYFVWNLFLLVSLGASFFSRVQFPAIIVGSFAGMELTVWICVMLFIGSNSIKEAVKKAGLVKWWRIATESIMVFSAFAMGFNKIGCAWLMIALLGFSVGEIAKKSNNA